MLNDYRLDKVEAEYKNFTKAKSLLLYYHHLGNFEDVLTEYKAITAKPKHNKEKSHV